jgi:hypothetical protein
MKSIPKPISSSNSGRFPSLIRPPDIVFDMFIAITGGGRRIKSKNRPADRFLDKPQPVA